MPGKPLLGVVAQQNAPPPIARGRRAVAAMGEEGHTLLHDLGNSLVAVSFGLERLRGSQRSEELETVLERTLGEAEQSIAVVRNLLQYCNRSRAV